MVATLRSLFLPALFWSLVAVGAPPDAWQIRDVDGALRNLFEPAGGVSMLVFVASDCPISNGYAPEVQRICDGYRGKGVSCTLVYEDGSIDSAGVRAHRETYRYHDIAAVIDADRTVARRMKATVTPEAVILSAAGAVKYRGRIDNQYAALGKPRRVVTVHDVREALDAVLAGKTVARPATEAFGCFIAPRVPDQSSK